LQIYFGRSAQTNIVIGHTNQIMTITTPAISGTLVHVSLINIQQTSGDI
jgi:hypothetical protein